MLALSLSSPVCWEDRELLGRGHGGQKVLSSIPPMEICPVSMKGFEDFDLESLARFAAQFDVHVSAMNPEPGRQQDDANVLTYAIPRGEPLGLSTLSKIFNRGQTHGVVPGVLMCHHSGS